MSGQLSIKMFRSKKDVDNHVQDILRKISNDKEKNLRCYNIAKLYYRIADYESAWRYITRFLSVKPDSATGHKLCGQIYEGLGQKEKAISEYKCSLELETSQPDVVLKVCEMLCGTDLSIDIGRARYWSDRAAQLYPHHPVVFKLKEQLLATKGEESLAELETLIASEVSARPSDVSLRIRLVKLYQDADRLKDAYDHVMEVERKSLFREELLWYECSTQLFKVYEEKCSESCGWEFYVYFISSQEKLAYLNLREIQPGSCRTVAECIQALFSFDQLLTKASQQSPPPSEREFYQEYLRHMRGQLCLHLSTLILKRTKKDQSNWRESCRMAAPLLLHALGPPLDIHNPWVTHASDSRHSMINLVAKEAAFRVSQAGHVIIGMLRERRSQFLDRVTQFCSGNWRERVFQRIFNTRDHQQEMVTSHFVNYPGFAELPLHIPTASELRPHDELSQHLYPCSLHHLVWLGLQEMATHKKSMSTKKCLDFHCLVFEGLQLSSKKLNSAGAETLCKLDVDAFLYATVLCTTSIQQQQLASGHVNSDCPTTLPACIMDQLCTVAQDKWWTAAYKIFKKQLAGNLGELRQILQHGIEVIRVVGNHGLDVRLIVQLARSFSERALGMTSRGESTEDISAVEARASLYWSSALPLLERLQRNQVIRAPHTRLFEYQGKVLSSAEISAIIEEGRFFLACQLMKEDKHERALDAFEQLKSPYASFYRAMIYKKLAAEQFQDQPGEMITSEMRSQHIILLTKARECLYLTLDRLKSPGVDSKHPLNAELSGHIEELESQLHHIDPDVCRSDANRNEVLEGLSVDTGSSVHSPVDNGNTHESYNNGFVQNSPLLHVSSNNRSESHRFSSTPYRSSHKLDISDAADIKRLEARPSPERLDAQIRQLIHNKDTVLQVLNQQSKSMMESINVILEELRDCKKEMKESKEKLQEYNQELRQNKQMVEELKVQVQELRKETSKLRKGHSRLNSELSQVCDPEDDLYVFDEEDYAEDVTIAASHMGTYPSFQPFTGYPNYRPVSGIVGASTVSYAPPPTETHPPFIPPRTQAIGDFFRGLEQTLLYQPSAVGYYGSQGALPFSDGQQLPDFHGHQAPPVFSRLGTHLAETGVMPEPKPSMSSAPVNVVITSSDTLPTTVPISQPTLSVTIPPQHRLGGIPLVQTSTTPSLPQTTVPTALASVKSVPLPPIHPPFSVPSIQHPTVPPPNIPSANTGETVPHAFQISMPPKAHVPQASFLEKGAAALSPILPIATHSLLSSVPSPVYSAVVTEKSPTTKEVSTSKQSHRVLAGSNAEEDDNDAEHDPCPDFQPVIPLPAEVEVTTGEEDETVLFESRAKLFRFIEKEWKERGVGNIKLLHNQRTGKVRILMRREQVLKVCANHFLSPEMELVPMKDRAWIWVANDFADEQVRLEKLCVRFKTPDEAANFKDAFEKAKEKVKSMKTVMLDKLTNSVAGKNETVVTSLQTSVTEIFSRSGPNSSLPNLSCSETITPTSSSATLLSSGLTFGLSAADKAQNKITFGGFTFAGTPTFKSNLTNGGKIPERESNANKTAGEDSSKQSPFASFTFPQSSKSSSFGLELSKSSPQLDHSSASKITGSGDSIVNTTADQSTKSSSFTFGFPSDTSKLPPPLRRPHASIQMLNQPNSQTTLVEQEKPVSKGDTLVFSSDAPTFADIAATTPVGKVGFSVDANFKGFEGAGTAVFKNAPVVHETKHVLENITSEKTVSEGTVDDFVPTAEFQPVIPLPELVEVKTGEEGEEVLFEERCKLLRYDGDNKEWKERGVGKMKLLHDPTTGRVRLLMRREQVLKVCCNHALTSAIKLKALSSSDRAWSWAAQDYSEGEMRRELLAIKFKNVDLAQKFKEVIENTQSKMKNDRLPVTKDTSNVKDKKYGGVWKCSECLFPNAADARSCRSCHKQRPRPNQDIQLDANEKSKVLEVSKMESSSGECSTCHSDISESLGCSSCSNKMQKTNADDANISQKSLLSEFKPKAGSWECKSCYTRNEGNVRHCVACEAPKTVQIAAGGGVGANLSAVGSLPLSQIFKPKLGSWTCNDCYTSNDSESYTCIACKGFRPGFEQKVDKEVVKDQTSFKFGIGDSVKNSSGFNLENFATTSSSAPFSFGIIPNATLIGNTVKVAVSEPDSTAKIDSVFGAQTKNLGTSFVFGSTTVGKEDTGVTPLFGMQGLLEKSQEGTGHSFTFGSPGKFEFSFSGIRPKSPVKSPKSPGTKQAVSPGEEESASETEEDEGDHIYFQPVIPLPDKVPLYTGEEEEDILYTQHAKLFRFVSGEWKERGLGDIKILRHRSTRKIRFLMRREQVLKICLNHFLTPELMLIEKGPKSWMWSAPDFSEGHIQNEQFAIRFKTPDLASAFKTAVEKAQIQLREDDNTVDGGNTSLNLETTPRSAAGSVKEDGSGDAGASAIKNFSFSIQENKTVATSSASKFSLSSRFGTPSAKGPVRSLFGGTSPDASDAKTDDVEVVYELAVTEEEKTEAERLLLPPNFFAYRRKPGCSGCPGCKDDRYSESDNASPLQPIGTKDSRNSDTATLSALQFGSDSSGKITEAISEGQHTSTSCPKSGSSILQQPTLSFVPTCGGESLLGKTSIANSSSSWFPLQKAPATSIANISEERSSLPSRDQSESLFQGRNSLFGNATVFVTKVNPVFGERPVFSETVPKAPSFTGVSLFGQTSELEFQDISKQYSEKNSSGAPFGFHSQKTESHSNSLFTLPSTDMNPGEHAALKFNFGQPSKSEKDPEIVKTPGFGFTSPFQTENILRASSIEKTESTSKMPSASVESSVSSSTPCVSEANKLQEAAVIKPPSFSAMSALSFADLAAQAKTVEKKQDPNFTWQGGSSFVFGRSQNTSQKPSSSNTVSVTNSPALGDESSDEETVGGDDNSHDPQFEPVIALPDTIEVRTGEEDESVEFVSRATLYRYVESSKEWKERGVGDMKILFHPVNHTYRLLLRREKIHKLVCNHLITPGFSMKPLTKSDRTWMWAAHNFVDDSGDLEKLAVRFKNVEISEKFYNKVMQCIEKLKQQQETDPASTDVTCAEKSESDESEDDNNEDDDDDDDGNDEEEDDEDDDDDEYDRYDDTEESMVFEKRATLLVEDGSQWNVLGIGDLSIQHDQEINKAYILMLTDTGEVLCNVPVTEHFKVELRKKECQWTGEDRSTTPSHQRTFLAKFSSESTSKEFVKILGQFQVV